MKRLYKFEWDCGRSGELGGLFIAEETAVNEAIGQQLYFGEVLGKHSEVYGKLEDGDITVVEVSEGTLEELYEKLGATLSGYNPLHYLPEDDE